MKRHHNYPILGEQRVSDHTWRMLIIAKEIFPEKCGPHFISAVLYHDVTEYKTGDVPANAKWKNKNLRKGLKELKEEIEKELVLQHDLSKHEKQALQYCDRLEHMIFCLEQRKLGNTYVDRPFANLVEYVLQEVGLPNTSAGELFEHVRKEYYKIAG